jgi:outer membrane protein insertion porin family
MNLTGDIRRLMQVPNSPACRILHTFAAAFHVFIGVLFSALLAVPAESIRMNPTLFGKTIKSIEISSDMPLDRSHYDPFIGIHPGDKLTRTGVKEAIQFFYACDRFSEVVVETFPEEDEVAVRFVLKQNYYFNMFFMEGNVNLKGRPLWELTTLPVGQRFTGEKLEESRQAVVQLMKDRGFFLAEIKARTVRDETRRLVNVVFEAQSGTLATIRSIAVTGVPSPETESLVKKFGFQKGKKYDRSRLSARLENLKKIFLKKGYLAAVARVSETFEPESNTVALILNVTNFGKMRVLIEGFKIDRDQLRRLLPVLSGEGSNEEILEKGLNNLKDYLENKGYPEAEITVSETVDDLGVRIFRHVIIPGRRFTVSYIRFQGTRIFTDREMLDSIESRPTTFFKNIGYSVSQLDEDVDSLKALYESRGYLDAEIIPLLEPAKDGKKVGIKFLCREGPLSRISSLTMEGNAALSTEALAARIKLAPGKAYSPSLVERDRQALLAAYNDLGYLQAQVAIRVGTPDKDNSYPVGFQIKEGIRLMVNHILVFGNERTRNWVIRRKILLKENEPLSLGKLLKTQQGLYGLGIYDQVRVTRQNPDSTAPFQDVTVRLQESKRFIVRYGLGYQEREKLRGTVEFTDLNLFGLGRRADIRLRGSSIEQQALFSLQQPQFRLVPVETYFTFSALQRSDVSFDSRRFNSSYQFSHPLSSHTWGMLRYNFKNIRIFNSQVPLSSLGREDMPVNLSTFSIAFVNDSRDDFMDPEKGFFSSTDFGVTTKLLGDSDYVSFFSQNSYFRSLPKSFLIAASGRVGLAHPYGGDTDLPISERFFAGGPSSLRGFETDYAGPLENGKPVGGNALIVGSMEIRIPVLRFLRLAGFYDTGNVFRTISDIDLADFSHTVGAGLRIKTPFGPLRADYGYNLNLPLDLQKQGLTRGHLFITVGPPF